MSIKMTTKLIKRGNSYCLAVPKGFIDTKVLNKDKYYDVSIDENSITTGPASLLSSTIQQMQLTA